MKKQHSYKGGESWHKDQNKHETIRCSEEIREWSAGTGAHLTVALRNGTLFLMNSFRQEMDRFLDDFGFGQSGFGSSMSTNWMPTTEVFERGNEIVFRVDLPGLNKEDVDVDIDEDQITIRGERKSEHEENRQGIFRSERHYGTFFRSIPLPPGADAEQAKANFRNGVLEITIPKPERSGARKLEIEENSR